MASNTPQRIMKQEYATNKRTDTLVNHLKRFIEWELHEVIDSHESKLPFTVHIKHKTHVRVNDARIGRGRGDFSGHQAEEIPDHAEQSHYAEHDLTRNMVVDAQRTHLGYNPSNRDEVFHSDVEKHGFATVITIVISEIPSPSSEAPGEVFSKEHAKQLEEALKTDINHELSGELEGAIQVQMKVGVGQKEIAREHVYNEPIMKRYGFASYVISFKWSGKPALEQKNTTYGRNEKIKGKNIDSNVNQTIQSVMQDLLDLARTFNVPLADLITKLDGELDD